MALRDCLSQRDKGDSMCTWIIEKDQIMGSGKGQRGWFEVKQAYVYYDHPFHAPLDHALNIDFVNEEMGPSARVAVELSPESARKLVRMIEAALATGEQEHGLPSGRISVPVS